MFKAILVLFFLGLLIALNPWIDIDRKNKQLIIWYGRDQNRTFKTIQYGNLGNN